MPAIIWRSTSASTQRSGLSSGSAAACSKLTTVPAGNAASPRTKTWLVMLAPAAGEQLLGDGPGGDAGGGFARAGALEDVAHVARVRT